MMENPRLSNEDWYQWARQPATAAFVQTLRATIADTQERWAAGHFTGETDMETLRLNGTALAQINMLEQVITQIEDYETEDEVQDD